MTPAAASAPQIRPLTAVEEFELCVELQSAIWGFAERDLVPRRMFVVAHKSGGQVLGAWAGADAEKRLVGFGLTLPGFRGELRYWHSHMLAVLPEYRNQGIGRRIKLRQRDEARARGLKLIEWTFDPLEIKNAYFNLSVLGAIARRYHPNLYGLTTSALQAGLPTDRLVAEWWLDEARVTALAAGRAAAAPAAARRVEVPAEIYGWKKAGDPRALAAQSRIRTELQAAFADGWQIVDYERRAEGEGCFRLAQVTEEGE